MCGYKPGDNQWSDQNGLTLDKIAKQLGISKRELQRALRIERNLTESMKELLIYEHVGDRQAQVQNGHVLTLDEIAKQLGTSKRDLQRALRIERNLTNSIKELLDDGGVFLDISPVKRRNI